MNLNTGLSIYETEGSPNGLLVSLGKGQLCVDRSTPALYQSTGAGTTGWSLVGTTGGDAVSVVVPGDGITVDDTDPSNPIVANAGVITVVAGTGITVDNTNPQNPIVSLT